MPKTIKVDLLDPVETHSGFVSVAEFKEPTGREYMELGEPYKIGRTEEGTVFSIDHDEKIQAYMERCIMQPINPVILGTFSLANIIACKEAFLGFFGEARQKISTGSVTSSSSS